MSAPPHRPDPAPPRAAPIKPVKPTRPRGDAGARAGLRPGPRLGRRRSESLANLLPVVGAFLLMPPFIGVFAANETVFGAPLILAYLLAVWLGLILIARRLARGLAQGLWGRARR